MSAVDETTGHIGDSQLEAIGIPAADASWAPSIPIELRLDEAEALLVSRVLARLGAAVDAARATVGIRQELTQVGVSCDHLSDEEIRLLARRIADAGSAAIRS
jgi:hypothetical protein